MKVAVGLILLLFLVGCQQPEPYTAEVAHFWFTWEKSPTSFEIAIQYAVENVNFRDPVFVFGFDVTTDTVAVVWTEPLTVPLGEMRQGLLLYDPDQEVTGVSPHH